MHIRCKYDEIISVKDLKKMVNQENTNIHPKEQIKRLAKIMEYQGVRKPIYLSKQSKKIQAGHGRLLSAIYNKWKEFPVEWQEYDDREQELADLTSDNAIASWADLDMSMVNEQLNEFGKDFDFDLLGLQESLVHPHMRSNPEKEEIEDDVPEDVDTRCKPGDLWVLGEHRLMCGDSTNVDNVENLMGGENADITFTSPPYNIGNSIRGNMYNNDDDKKTDDDYLNFLIEWTNIAIMKSRFVFHNNQFLEGNKKQLIKYQYHFVEQIKDILVWNKKQYPPHINKGTFGCKWEYVMCLSNDGKSRSFPCSWQGKFSNVIETESNSGNEFADTHKAGFPVSFPEWIIDKMDFAKTVFDPFGGTGTTLIACEKTNRKCYMMELDPHYCDVILTRWEKYSDEKAAKIKQKGRQINERH